MAQLNAQRRDRGLEPLRANDALGSMAQLLLAIKHRYRYSTYFEAPKGKPLSSERLLDPAATDAGISIGRIGKQLVIAVVVAAEEARPAPPAPATPGPAEEARPAPPADRE